MKIILLPALLTLSLPAFAGSSALEALRAQAGPVAIQVPPVVSAQAAPSAPADFGAALAAEYGRRAGCYDGRDPEVHGAPMCAVALSNDPSEQHYIHSSASPRGGSAGDLHLRREIKTFAIGKSLFGDFISWAVNTNDVVMDSDGRVVSGTFTTSSLCASEQACAGFSIQPYQVRTASGAEKTVYIGRKVSPLSAPQIRAELEKALAVIRAK